jgi:hypothetical protein
MATYQAPKETEKNNKALQDWERIHAGFKYSDPTPIRARIREKGLKAMPEDFDVINAIVLWKINREVSVSLETVEFLNSMAGSVATPEEALRNAEVPLLVKDLIESRGIGLPVASAILKQYCPNAFPIIDQRAYFVLYGEKLPMNAGVDVYLDYMGRCASLATEHRIPFEKVDEVLYQIDKNSGRTLNSTGDE